MQIGWLVVLGISCGLIAPDVPQWQRKYELQRAPEFLFQRGIWHVDCAEWPSSQPARSGSYVTFSPRAPYRRTHLEDLSFSQKEIPALILASDVAVFVKVEGEERNDWSLQFCAKGEGNTDAEAQGHMRDVSLTRLGGMVSVAGRGAQAQPNEMADIFLHAPADSPATFHLDFGAITVYGTSAPVLVAAPRGRATFLQTTGRVEATGEVIDFAGAKGTVDLNASTEINLKLTSTRFDGTLTASAHRSVRVLVPQGFQMPFQAIVSRRDDFACRTDFCANVKLEKKNGLFIFSYAGNGDTSEPLLHLRSEDGPVVMDTSAL